MKFCASWSPSDYSRLASVSGYSFDPSSCRWTNLPSRWLHGSDRFRPLSIVGFVDGGEFCSIIMLFDKDFQLTPRSLHPRSRRPLPQSGIPRLRMVLGSIGQPPDIGLRRE